MSAPPAGPRKRKLAAMQAGRERAHQERRQRAVERVEAWKAWLRRGSPLDGSIPEVPSDSEWHTWEGRRG